MSFDTIAQALAWANQTLDGGESPQLDAKVLLAHCLNQQQIYLHTWPEKTLTAEQKNAFVAMVEVRAAGTPVAHITRHREFWSLELEVSNATLIPRPDTEILVEHALSLALPAQARILDLGTGTGAIALALAFERPGWHVTALDVVGDAVALAERNRQKHDLQNVTVLHSDWFAALEADQRFDLIVSNPPYVEENSPWLERGDVRFEPHSALTSGEDGLDDIRKICAQAFLRLQPGGWLMLEHGFEQGKRVREQLAADGFGEVQTLCDLSQLPRATVGRKTR